MQTMLTDFCLARTMDVTVHNPYDFYQLINNGVIISQYVLYLTIKEGLNLVENLSIGEHKVHHNIVK